VSHFLCNKHENLAHQGTITTEKEIQRSCAVVFDLGVVISHMVEKALDRNLELVEIYTKGTLQKPTLSCVYSITLFFFFGHVTFWDSFHGKSNICHYLKQGFTGMCV